MEPLSVRPEGVHADQLANALRAEPDRLPGHRSRAINDEVPDPPVDQLAQRAPGVELGIPDHLVGHAGLLHRRDDGLERRLELLLLVLTHLAARGLAGLGLGLLVGLRINDGDP